MHVHKLTTFWFKKVTSSLYVMLKLLEVKNVEECVLQHKLSVGDLDLNTTFSKSHCIPPKQKLWKLSDPEAPLQFGNYVQESAQSF